MNSAKGYMIHAHIMHEKESAYRAHYFLSCFSLRKIIVVVDDLGKAVGIVTPSDLRALKFESMEYCYYLRHDWLDGKSVGDVCNKDFKYIKSSEDRYTSGRNIFADSEAGIGDLPILDDNHVPIDIFSRWQAFFWDFFAGRHLNRFSYASVMMNAAKLARRKGYDKISVIEFGVGGGGGMMLAELYAREITRITGIAIKLIGFEWGKGLPKIGYKDGSAWSQGDYASDISIVQNMLPDVEFVIGDIKETCKTYLEKYKPAPIGGMLVDVDVYSTTVAILDLLAGEDDYFLPTVYMYFDDMDKGTEFDGESLAIKEFNTKYDHLKISPEIYVESDSINYKLKQCNRYLHSRFNSDKKEPSVIEYTVDW